MAEVLLSCLTTWSHLQDDGLRSANNVHNLIGMPRKDSIAQSNNYSTTMALSYTIGVEIVDFWILEVVRCQYHHLESVGGRMGFLEQIRPYR